MSGYDCFANILQITYTSKEKILVHTT